MGLYAVWNWYKELIIDIGVWVEALIEEQIDHESMHKHGQVTWRETQIQTYGYLIPKM